MNLPPYPFTAIVGQQSMKRALIFNTIDPAIGGVLITGTRGTAKTTTVRALPALLPEISMIPGSAFNLAPRKGIRTQEFVRVPTPFLTLPLSSNIEQVAGILEVEKVLQTGERHFEPGLLARANRGILYIDNINHFRDDLLAVILEAVTSTVNRVEREGVTFDHQADIILVATTNPDSRELHPQLLDRFGLYVITDSRMDLKDRYEIIKRCMAYNKNPRAFFQQWQNVEQELARKIERARAYLNQVEVSEASLEEIAHICGIAQIDGMRSDIAIYKTARVIAAFEGEKTVNSEHIKEAAELALAHRRRISTAAETPNLFRE
ncbi:ATP-binding protein [Candidatus Venteria ishoeyi]|uniref:Mg-protoporphyrin IX chelatase n=1 Tax=Candidatus Venteria ishoeyi TaxID=1899563 RepID=A0A1H6FAZ3_9GAMM|nr:ATP-binding protein [Candidatus Venteria ishoeyi]MDM8545374.1 ATP-binding protein [Candidatus Venteria ishoeyi]SEH07262.1 Magnesium-chelatase 38 kDa subunit [Candidatus Venteria ishoeyi]